MLTISTIKNSSGAAKYYAKEDNYYLAEINAQERSEWWGEGATRLNLKGKVLEEKLKKVLAGELPSGTTIGLQKDGTRRHRAGFDLCFQAPKSVSILALAGGDKRLYHAHLEAAKETLHEIEKDCAAAKVFKTGKISFERTKNLVVALINHSVSRELDPHLHQHALIMNATQREDKKWRALASSMTHTQYGFLEKIYNNQIYYGMLYKHALANRVINIGYAIETTGANGLWEIKGVPKEIRDIMSKRRKQIEEQLKDLSYSSLQAADVAALDTREKKPKNIKLTDIQKGWNDTLAKLGFSAKEFIAKQTTKEKSNTQDVLKSSTKDLAKESIRDAIEHLSQYSLKLDYAKLVSQALAFSLGKTIHGAIITVIKEMIKEGELISLDKTDGTFITQKLIATEKSIMDLVAKDKRSDFAITIKDNELDSNLDPNLAAETKDCAMSVLHAKARLSLIESAKQDNIDFLTAILTLAEGSGKTVRILSPNRLMASNITANVKRKPNKVWQWLISLGKPEIGECVAGFKYRYQEELNLPSFLLRLRQGKEIVIVDNAERLGCDDTQELLALTAKAKAKLIFLQDITTKFSTTVGNSLETLKQAGIETFKLGKEQDKNNNFSFGGTTELKAVKDDYVRIRQLAKEYAQKESLDRDATLILVGSNSRLKKTNAIIREELQNHGQLSGIEHAILVLNPVFMSKPEARLAQSYQKNMVIRMYQNHLSIVDWRVKSFNRGTNMVRLTQNGVGSIRSKKNAKRMLWNPKKEKPGISHAVFKQERLKIAKGDKLIATSNMRAFGIKTATKFTVNNLDEKYLELTCAGTGANKPKVFKIKLSDLTNSHLQYDYATTLHRSAKNQVSNVIADVKAYALDKSIVAELTKRTQNSLIIFTDNVNLAEKRFSHLPLKYTAVDVLLEASGKPKLADSKSLEKITSDITQAISTLKDQYAFRSQPERKAVEFALEKITLRNAGFSYEELVTEALHYVLKEQLSAKNKSLMREAVTGVIAAKHNAGELVTDGNIWTTKQALELERSIIAGVKRGVDKLQPLLDTQDLKDLNTTNLTSDQKNAITLIGTTKDQYVVMQGYAGTGKTTIFAHLQDLLQQGDKKTIMLALAPTHRAVKELKDRGINAQTLKSFLIEQAVEENTISLPQKNLKQDKLIILDEASMVPNEDSAKFIQIVGKGDAHVVLSGDIAQHIAIESGKPFEIIQRSNILQTATLKEIVRQKNPVIKEAVKDTIRHDYKKVLNKIGGLNPQDYISRLANDEHKLDTFSIDFFKKLSTSVIEIDNNRLQKYGIPAKPVEQVVAEDFLTRAPEFRDNTVIIAHAHEDRRVITAYIREGLKKQGVIAKEGVLVDNLISKRLTEAEHKSLQFYTKGDVVRFGKKYYHVLERNDTAEIILLKDEVGKKRHFYPAQEASKYNVELYRHTIKELAVGDRIRLTKTDKKGNYMPILNIKLKR